MPYDGFVTAAMRAELEARLGNARVDRVHQGAKDELLIHMRQPSDNYRLLLSAHPQFARVHLTTEREDPGHDSLLFATVVRKVLRGARLVSVTQPNFDRILEFRFETFDDFGLVGEAILTAEIMGKHSNVILVDPSTGSVIESLKRISGDMSRVREVLPGQPYTQPPDQGKLDPRAVARGFFMNLLLAGDATKTVAKTLQTNYQGISPMMSREIAARASVPADREKSDLSESDAEALWAAFDALMSDVREDRWTPYTYTPRAGRAPDFSAVLLQSYDEDWTAELGTSISEIVDLFFTRKDEEERLERARAELRRALRQHIERCSKKLALQEDSRRAAQGADAVRIQGDLIMANLRGVSKGDVAITVPNLYAEDQGAIAIPLDPALSPIDNAQRYYRRYARARNSITAVEEQIAHTWEEFTYLEQVEVALDNSDSLADLAEVRDELMAGGYIRARRGRGKGARPAKPSPKARTRKASGSETGPIRFTTSDGYEVLVGKNNRQNDLLTMKLAQPTDLWFHTKDIPGSHVILRTSGLPLASLPDQAIVEAAQYAAGFSKARGSSHVPVDYALRKNVRKPSGAKPGMVIYDSQFTVFVTPHSSAKTSSD